MTFIVTVFTGVIATLIYNLVLSQREDAIRRYLSRLQRGAIRRLYVSAFVGAVRGRAVAKDTSLLTALVQFAYLAGAFFFLHWAIDTRRSIEFVEGSLLKTEQRLAHAKLHRSHQFSTEEAKSEIDNELAQMENEFAQGKTEFDKVSSDSTIMVPFMIGMGTALFATFVLGELFYRPFLIMRRRFAFELDRFALRVQGLAIKEELAELALAESQVVDEGTLRVFIDIARRVATRHKVPQLVRTFDLWQADNQHASIA